MSEGTHSNSTPKPTNRKHKIALIVGGTAVTLLAAGLFWQVFRAETGEAGVSGTTQSSEDEPGRVSVAAQRSKSVARVTSRGDTSLISYDLLADECIARYGKDVLDSLINRTIIQQACQERGVVVTEQEVTQEVIKIAKKFNLAADNWYAMLQKERSLTPVQYRRDVIWPMLALKKLAGDGIEITQEMMDQSFVREYGPRVKARMIMLQSARHAQDVWKLAVKNPENFGRLAREYSVDSNSKSMDGAIPPIPRFAGYKNIEEAAFKLRDGEVSGIIEFIVPTSAEKRYAILLCEGRTKPVVKDINEVRDLLYEQLLESEVQKSVSRVFGILKKEAEVDNFLTNTSTRRVTNSQIRQTSGNGTSPGKVRPATGTQPATTSGNGTRVPNRPQTQPRGFSGR